ncbi:response regulator [bacterium]|nr:response regulator [bacterium]
MVHILIVEDDEVVRDLLTEVCERWGYTTECVDNGRKGLEKFYANSYTLIISDIRMPVMDGLTMLEHIREKDSYIPIIIVTAYPSVDSAVESLEKGADYYLVKPVNLNDLKAKIHKCLDKIHIQKKIDSLKTRNRILTLLIPAGLAAGFALAWLLL